MGAWEIAARQHESINRLDGITDSSGTTCLTRSQVDAVLSASAATGAPAHGGGIGAPAASSASVVEPDTDIVTTTTSSDTGPITLEASSTPELSPPANDNPQPQGAELNRHVDHGPTARPHDRAPSKIRELHRLQSTCPNPPTIPESLRFARPVIHR
jgi:hypothetical protein